MSQERPIPNLSILICSIPSRWDKAKALYNHCLELVGDKNIEVLLFMDNKKRTIGEKREAIKNISNGKYFMFVDDDDSLYSIDSVYAATKEDVDVITFKSKCKNSDGSEYIVSFGLRNEVEHNTNEKGFYVDLKRPPFPQCAWNGFYYKTVHYPKFNYGEDWGWVKKAINKIPEASYSDAEFHIDEIIHGYNFDPKVSEAEV